MRLLRRFPRSLRFPTLAVVIVAAAWLSYSHFGASQEPPSRLSKSHLEALLQAASYTFEDGQVREGGDKPASDKDPGKVDALDLRLAYERANRLAAEAKGKVLRDKLEPHWLEGGKRFWYRRDLKLGVKEFVLVEAETGKRGPAFDHDKLAASLSKAAGVMYTAKRLPFDAIDFAEEGKSLRFTIGKNAWQCDLTSYECTRTERAPKQEETDETPRPDAARNDAEVPDDAPEPPDDVAQEPQQKKKKGGKGGKGFAPPQAQREAKSPDGAWTALVKNDNVVLRDKDGKETPVTDNGFAASAYSAVAWAPDSKTLVCYRSEPGDDKQVHMIETSPKDQLPAKLHSRVYPRPGDKFHKHEIWLVPMETKKPVQVEVEKLEVERGGPPGLPRLRWSKDNTRFTFEKRDRGHQRFRIIEADARTGKTRHILDEKSKTFIDVYSFRYQQYLDDTSEILYTSEQDGWKHLYLIDAKTAKMKQITKGEYVVRAVDRVDVKKRQIWFQASGKNPGQDPYFLHFYRINFDGTGLVALTEGDGTHTSQYSPDGKHLIDTYSRVDLPPVHELRRTSDGGLVCKLDEADVSALAATGWKAPEVFVSKARDDKTDIWGIVCRPRNYDPAKKYPVIEYIYAGPQGSFTPKSFAAFRPMQALAELGFIVVQCDGLGTANRARAFHDVCHKNLADAGFPDRILWMKALARKYAYVDITRVGIYGTSAGGQSSTGAVLFHPEFYKVAVSSCGCHDNRLDKVSWNEQWMGLMGPHYKEQSNVTNAHKLQGRLMLIVGELDTNVPFESTMRVADALIRAQKDFELIVVPGMGHSDGGQYGNRRRWDFFVRHLHGVEPPARNGGAN